MLGVWDCYTASVLVHRQDAMSLMVLCCLEHASFLHMIEDFGLLCFYSEMGCCKSCLVIQANTQNFRCICGYLGSQVEKAL